MVSLGETENNFTEKNIKEAIKSMFGDKDSIVVLLPMELKYIDEGNSEREVIDKKGNSKMTKVSNPNPVIRKAYFDMKCEMEDGSIHMPKGDHFLTVIASQFLQKVKNNCADSGVDMDLTKKMRIAEDTGQYENKMPSPKEEKKYQDGQILSDIGNSEKREHDKKSRR